LSILFSFSKPAETSLECRGTPQWWYNQALLQAKSYSTATQYAGYYGNDYGNMLFASGDQVSMYPRTLCGWHLHHIDYYSLQDKKLSLHFQISQHG